MNSSEIKIRGLINLKLFDKDGVLKDERTVENTFVNAGRAALIDRLQGNTPAVPDYIAIGTGSSGPTAGDTTMGTETARSQGALTQPDAYTDRDTYTFGAGVGTGTIAECGRFNASSGPTLWGRQVFTGIVKGANDSLQITYDFLYTAS